MILKLIFFYIIFRKLNESKSFIEQDPLEREIHTIKLFYSCEV